MCAGIWSRVKVSCDPQLSQFHKGWEQVLTYLQDTGVDLRKCFVILALLLALYQALVSLILTLAPWNTDYMLGLFSDSTSLSVSIRKLRGNWVNLSSLHGVEVYTFPFLSCLSSLWGEINVNIKEEGDFQWEKSGKVNAILWLAPCCMSFRVSSLLCGIFACILHFGICMSEAICIGKTIIGRAHSIFFHMLHCERVQSNIAFL